MLIELIKPASKEIRTRLAIAVILSALANTCMMVFIQIGMQSDADDSAYLLLMLWVACVLYILSLRQCTRIISTLFETALYDLRLRFAEKIRRADLMGLEQIGAAQLYARVTQATSVISNNALTIALALASLGTVIFLVIYITVLSKFALGLVLVCYGGGSAVFYLRRRKIRLHMQNAAEQQMGLFKSLEDLLRGSKEIRLHKKRGDALMLQIREMAASLSIAPAQTNDVMRKNFVFARMFMFALLAAIVWGLPQLVPTQLSLINTLVPVVILLFVPLLNLLRALPEYERADVAAANLHALEARLNRVISAAPAGQSDPWGGRFTELRAVELSFHHTDVAGHSLFSVGPLSFSIRAGEVTFLTGGNGAGKTTILKLLTTLYSPASGTLVLDGIPISAENVSAYREMIAAIFADFHLFRKLYGLSDIKDQQVTALLEQLQIADSTACENGTFSNLALSTGQGKRLAMAVALLEDRPLFVFDEWAADQDPSFRRYFYEELLPELRRRRKTVLAISHDDRYFHAADQVITIMDGRVQACERRPPSVPSEGVAHV